MGGHALTDAGATEVGILDALTGRKKILTYEIIFRQGDDRVGIRVVPLVPEVQGPDYVRLWACYHAKIMYNLGFPRNTSSVVALELLRKIFNSDVDAGTDCFARAEVDDVIQYASAVNFSGTTFTGEFYAKGSMHRFIQTHFPLGISEQQVVYSSLALLQYGIGVNRDDPAVLKVLSGTAQNMIEFYNAGAGGDLRSMAEIPTVAYLRAIGLA